jgi:hypothetical protein
MSSSRTGNASACDSLADQYMDVHAPFVLGSRRLLHVGAISGSVYVDRVAQATVARFRASSFLLGAEDVTGQPGFEFALRIYAPDAWITGTPAFSWEAQALRSNGTVPPQPGTAEAAEPQFVQTSAGMVTLTQSAFSPSVFHYNGQTFGDGTFMFALDAREAAAPVTSASSATPCDVFTMQGGNQTVKACAPNLTPTRYGQLRSAATFGHSFIAVVGDRVWRLHIATPPDYSIDHTQSTFALAGGLLTAFLLSALAVGAVYSRDARVRSLERDAATQAHQVVCSYAAHELRQPGEWMAGVCVSEPWPCVGLLSVDDG